jgi:AcrR family transcriptional regulator
MAIIKDDGLEKLTRMSVANMAGIAPSSVNAIFGSMEGLREAVVQFAIDELCGNIHDELMLHIVADGLVKGYQTAKHAPQGIRKAAMLSVM